MTIRTFISESLHSDERAVSPVIGVILMVAITVILAAVIGAFVLGIGDDVQQDVQAGVSVSGENTQNVTVTWTSQGTATELYIQAGDNVVHEPTGFQQSETTMSNVGDTVELSGKDGGTVSVVAHNENDNINTTIRTIDIRGDN